MFELKNRLILYHGSYCEVKKPDLAKCAKQKDFGQGFYLTTSKEQAVSFLKTAIAKASAAGKIEGSQTFGYVSTFEFINSNELKIHLKYRSKKPCIYAALRHFCVTSLSLIGLSKYHKSASEMKYFR